MDPFHPAPHRLPPRSSAPTRRTTPACAARGRRRPKPTPRSVLLDPSAPGRFPGRLHALNPASLSHSPLLPRLFLPLRAPRPAIAEARRRVHAGRTAAPCAPRSPPSPPPPPPASNELSLIVSLRLSVPSAECPPPSPPRRAHGTRRLDPPPTSPTRASHDPRLPPSSPHGLATRPRLYRPSPRADPPQLPLPLAPRRGQPSSGPPLASTIPP